MPLRLAVFDFDCTLSCQHVFSLLAHGHGVVPGPYASTERGQLAKLRHLDEAEIFAEDGGFARHFFGGDDRILELRWFFEHLTKSGVECVVCSRGLVGPIRKCLAQVGLLQYFSRIFANIGDYYPSTAFDKEVMASEGYESDDDIVGEEDDASWETKGDVLYDLMSRLQLQREEAIFVDDTLNEVESCRPLCHVLHVKPAAGLTSDHLDYITGFLDADVAMYKGDSPGSLRPKQDADIDYEALGTSSRALDFDMMSPAGSVHSRVRRGVSPAVSPRPSPKASPRNSPINSPLNSSRSSECEDVQADLGESPPESPQETPKHASPGSPAAAPAVEVSPTTRPAPEAGPAKAEAVAPPAVKLDETSVRCSDGASEGGFGRSVIYIVGVAVVVLVAHFAYRLRGTIA